MPTQRTLMSLLEPSLHSLTHLSEKILDFISCQGKGFSLSIFSNGQILKMGTSVDYSVCKGKRKDGIACTMVINKKQEKDISLHGLS